MYKAIKSVHRNVVIISFKRIKIKNNNKELKTKH